MNDLDELRDLLFGREKEVLDSISKRVERRELRAQDIADVLPEAIHASQRENNELSAALREPVGECLKDALRDDPQTYGDALYPVMGPAIRKSIMHALRTFAQQINEAVEQSLTPRGLSWRFQAWRAGVPFGDFVMQKTLLYRVEQAYLISRENGLLVGHVQHEAANIKDSDAVSAMFTAIQDFVKESFSPDRTGRLESADMGEFTLWAVHGPHALLVCVIRGVPPRALRGELSAILERIHFRYGDAIRDYAGDTSTMPDVEVELLPCLNLQAKHEKAKTQRRISWPLLLIALLFLAGVGYLLVTKYLQHQKLDQLVAALDSTPGVIITDANATRLELSITGLRDPLAADVATIAAAAGLADTMISSDLRPFYSMDPALVAQREAAADAARRAEQRQRLLEQLDRISGRRFFFSEGAAPTAESEIALAEFVAQLNILANDLADTGMAVEARIIGYADRVGGPEVNAIVARERANSVAAALKVLGWDGKVETDSVLAEQAEGAAIDLERRRVVVELQATGQTSAQ